MKPLVIDVLVPDFPFETWDMVMFADATSGIIIKRVKADYDSYITVLPFKRSKYKWVNALKIWWIKQKMKMGFYE